MSIKRLILIFLVPGAFMCAQSKILNIRNIDINGNDTIKDRELRSLLRLKEPQLFSKTDYDRRIHKLDAIIIKNYYVTRGFLNATVKDSFSIDDSEVDLFYLISEGEQTILEAVDIVGNSVISKRKILNILGLKLNRPYNPLGMNSNIPALENEFAKHGKLFTSINIFESTSDTFSVLLDIEEGPDVYINKINFNFASELDSQFVYRELQIKSGDLYQQADIDESQKRILETGIYSFVKTNPLRSITDTATVDLLIELRRFKQREIISEGGFYPIRYLEAELEIPTVGGTIEWRNRDIFDSFYRFSVKSAANFPITEELQQTKFVKFSSAMTISTQWFAGFRIPTSLSGYYETYTDISNKNYPRIQKYGSSLNYNYRLNLLSYIRTGLQWEKFLHPETEEITDIEKRTINFDIRWDGTDNVLNPGRGSIFTLNVVNAGGILGGNRTFLKLDFGISTYNTIFWKIILAGRIKYGFMYGWDSDYPDPQYDKFYLGGSTSLRGWQTYRFKEDDENNPQGEPIRILTNWELRIPLIWKIGCELFIDGGSLANSFESFSVNEMEWDGGAGLVFQSPLGPIRIDYAVHLNDPGNRTLVFGVLYAF